MKNILLIICIALIAVFIVAGIKNVNAKVKYDMTYGLHINAKDIKIKKLSMRNGTNIITVIPDYPDNLITCSILDDDANLLDKDINVNKCEYVSKKKENVVIEIQNCMTKNIGVELKHLLK